MVLRFVNSAAHLWGSVDYATGDQSRNNWCPPYRTTRTNLRGHVRRECPMLSATDVERPPGI